MFSLDGRQFLLTWPKSGQFTITLLLKLIQDIAEVRYACVCKEEHKDGDEHHHAVVVFEKRLQKRKNVFNFDETGCNVRRLKTVGDVKRAIAYVQKDGIFQEVGEKDVKWLKMDKREKAYFALSHTNTECIDSGQYSFSELTKLQQIRNLFLMDWPQFKKRHVRWYWGNTGTGKTRTAWQLMLSKGYSAEGVWMSAGKLDPFFNGYTGQKAVILDDFRPGHMRFEMLLRILDGYPVIVNVKNGYVQWCAEEIVITAPTKPTEMYVNRETGELWDNIAQLLRRIDETKEFTLEDSMTQEE